MANRQIPDLMLVHGNKPPPRLPPRFYSTEKEGELDMIYIMKRRFRHYRPVFGGAGG